ncbi:hypothetical protein [Oscillibacter ruminantium]|jgi:hypothetical protein|uniref:hypothetical protein n=1 Tax=Oscillibacter ruminantium TaxID=1263547 RepID=UPI001181B674|nr:hypothetical protein [Oscillibacter ruminantium]
MTSAKAKLASFFVIIVYLFLLFVKDMRVNAEQCLLLAFMPTFLITASARSFRTPGGVGSSVSVSLRNNSEDIASTNFYAFAKIAAEAETGNFLSLKSTFDHLASL